MAKDVNKSDLLLEIESLKKKIKKLQTAKSSASNTSANSLQIGESSISPVNYKLLFENMREGFLHGEINCKNKKPVDFRVLYTNKAFENYIGFKPKQLNGKLISKVLPAILKEKANWIKIFGEVALSGKTSSVTEYSSTLKRWFSANVFQPQSRQFAATFFDITQRMMHEKALEESEYHFRNLIKQAPDAFYLSDLDGNIITVNDLALKQSGYRKAEIKKKTVLELNPHLKRRKKLQSLWKSLELNMPVTIESHHQRKDGTVYPVEITTSRIELNDESYIMSFVHDITERKKTQNTLKESEERHKIISSLSSDYIYSVNLKSLNLDWASGAFKKITGYTADEVNKLPKKWMQVVHPDDIEKSTEFFYKQIKDKKKTSYDMRIIRKDGAVRWINDKFLATYNGAETVNLYGAVKDITEQKQAEQTLRESEEKYKRLIDQSGDAIYLLYNNNFELINKKFQELFGVTRKEVSKSSFNFMKMVAPKSKALIEERNRKYLEGEKLEPNYLFTALTAKGKEVLLEANVSYVEYKDGLATQGILRDITYRKSMEEQLRQSQKMKAVGQLAGGIAHDFNNLLTVINGYCDLLQLGDLQEEIRRPISIIKEASDRATALTSQLLAFSRKQVIRPKIINLNEVLKNQIKMLRRLIGEDIEISMNLQDNLDKIKIDSGQIEQIIMNIAINARDAMPGGGKLTIKTQNTHFDKEYVKNHPDTRTGKYISIMIKDIGIGMDAETSARVFEPFFTTKERDKGTGLGLATVYGIVKQNAGFIYVDTELDKGTSIIIYLPAAKGRIQKQQKKPAKGSAYLKGSETILLVEDDDIVRDVTFTTLESYGYSVMAAANGEEALRIYKINKNKIDLVLTDIIMPLMSGKELAEILLKMKPDVKILLFSGYIEDSILDIKALDTDLNFIQKPYTHSELAKKIKEVLDKN